jgi:hypothetical protein
MYNTTFRKRLNAAASLSKDLLMGTRLAFKLPFFLRHPITFEEARGTVRDRLEQREESFLATVRKAIYPFPENPYRKLLDLAGCKYGDFENLVNEEGVEGALQVLFRNGVYLTVDEFKGRKPVVRGSFKMEAHPDLFRNPFSASHFCGQTSGSRSARTFVYFDLASTRERAINYFLTFKAHECSGWVTSVWMGPGGADYNIILTLACTGLPMTRWFLRGGDPSDRSNLPWRWKTSLMRWGSLVGGIGTPEPTFVPHDDPLPIVHWMSDVLQTGKFPFLWGFSSSAVNVCRTAERAGIDLSGAKFLIGGEPITKARLEAIHASCAEVISIYTSIETGLVGFNCLEPEASDDMHLLHDLNALIQPESESQNFPPNALFITSLQPTPSFLLLNVSMGDMAVITKHECGCPLQDFGWDTHLHTIQSHEKLTTCGLTMLDTDVIRVLEEFLPARFGGGPTDYQLLEEESEGQPHLTLLVSPAINQVGTNEIVEAFLKEIRASNSRLWRTPGFFTVDRREPITTASGKILHLHTWKSKQSLSGRD